MLTSCRLFDAMQCNECRNHIEPLDFFDNSFQQIQLIELIIQISTETLIVI